MTYIDKLKTACAGATAGEWKARPLGVVAHTLPDSLRLPGAICHVTDPAHPSAKADQALIVMLANCRDEIVAVVEADERLWVAVCATQVNVVPNSVLNDLDDAMRESKAAREALSAKIGAQP